MYFLRIPFAKKNDIMLEKKSMKDFLCEGANKIETQRFQGLLLGL
jgi:hypothetical protein